MAITISTHLGTSVSLAHNRRDKDFIEKENANWAKRHPGEIRIDPNGHKEIWVSQDLRESYDVLFADAVKDFNQKQIKNRNPERMIKNYLSHLQARENKHKNSAHVIYEIIYTVGNMQKPVEETAARSILRKVAFEFEKRNPNLYVVFKGMHCDEMGASHVHISFIPIAHNCNRGMKTRNSFSLALKQQGICSLSKSQTAQILFEKQENLALEKICNLFGYEVEHPTVGQKVEHLSIEEYRLKKSIEEKQAQLEVLNNLPLNKKIINTGRLEQLENIEVKYKKYRTIFEKNMRENKAAREAIKNYAKMLQKLEYDRSHFDEAVNDAANKKIGILNNHAISFIKSVNLWDQFMSFSSMKSQSVSKKIK